MNRQNDVDCAVHRTMEMWYTGPSDQVGNESSFRCYPLNLHYPLKRVSHEITDEKMHTAHVTQDLPV